MLIERLVRGTSDQSFQQELQLADLDLALERIVGAVDDRDGQRAIVAITLKLGDDPSVLDLALADTDLKLAGVLAGVAKLDVLHVGIDGVEFGLLVRALEVMAGVEREGQAGE